MEYQEALWNTKKLLWNTMKRLWNTNEFSGLSEFAQNLHEVEHFAQIIQNSSDWDAFRDNFGPLHLYRRAQGKISSI